MTKIYFAADGSYGSADSLAVFDTSGWTDDDWFDIEDASDSERLAVAKEIMTRRATIDQERLFDIEML